jgi:hypothetical protein
MLIVRDVDAIEPPAPVDQISDLTAVPLLTKARKLQTDPPLSLIELMEEDVIPRAQAATNVFPVLLV